MNKFKKIFIISILFLFVSTLLLQIDDELSTDAVEMIDAVDWQNHNEAYVYLLGIGAELGQDPLVEGSLVLAEIRKSEAIYSDARSYESWGTYERRPVLELPDNDLLCSLHDADCTASRYLETDIVLDEHLTTELIARYMTSQQ